MWLIVVGCVKVYCGFGKDWGIVFDRCVGWCLGGMMCGLFGLCVGVR